MAGALLVCCVVLVAVLAALFWHQTTADGLDRAVDTPVINWFAAHRGLARWLAAPGSLIPVAALMAVLVIPCVVARRLNAVVLALTAVPVAEAISEGLLKPLVHRTYLGGIAFPSGHTTAVFGLTATVVVLLAVPAQPIRTGLARRLRPMVLAAAFVVCVSVSTGLIGLKWHYFTDVVAGAAVGTGTVAGLCLILDLAAMRRFLAKIEMQASLVGRRPASCDSGTARVDSEDR